MSRTRPPRLHSGAHTGFSMPELIMVVVIGALLVMVLQQALVGQHRFYDSQRAAVQRHETLRLAMAIMSSPLREANVARGDVGVLGPGRVRVRMPLGSAFVCGTDANGSRVGAVDMQGQWNAGVADSILILRSGVWTAEGISSLGGPDRRVDCVAGGGAVLRLDRRVPDVDLGTAARAFRSYVFEVDTDGLFFWLYRWDGAQRDLLLGPLDGPTGFQVWYEDAQGVVLPGPVGAQRVGIRFVARSMNPFPVAGERTDSLVMTFGGRNP